MNKEKILVVDDEDLLVKGIRFNLQNEGYEVITGSNGLEALQLCQSASPDLIVRDVMMPEMDGLTACAKIREFSNVPIILLTAKVEDMDKLMGFDNGADDYITKPFGTAELQARVRAALRIHQQNMNRSLGGTKNFQIGELVIDYDTRHVLIKEEDIKLTQTEYNIVALLAAHAGKVMTYSEIIKEIWKWSDAGSVKKLQVNMANIRKKIGSTPGDNKYIINELGVGYRIGEES